MDKRRVWTVCEYYGKGDPYFGGQADDRPLGKSGEFLSGSYLMSDVAEFDSREGAEAAADAAPNRRSGGVVGVASRPAMEAFRVGDRVKISKYMLERSPGEVLTITDTHVNSLGLRLYHVSGGGLFSGDELVLT